MNVKPRGAPLNSSPPSPSHGHTGISAHNCAGLPDFQADNVARKEM
jgi:hypothetical protein